VSDTRKRGTGLGGSNAFFKDTPPPRRDAPAAPIPPHEEIIDEPSMVEQEQVQDTNEKVRTTVKLYPDTLALMDMLRAQAKRDRKLGRKATYSDILDEAIRDLADKRGIKA
jgi:hypothetical protein